VSVLEGRPAALVVDGQEAGRLDPGDSVTCRITERPVRVVSLGQRGLGGLLRITLALDRDR
jgi:NAD kinase